MNIQKLCTIAALTAVPCLVQPAMANKVSKAQVVEKLTIYYNALNDYYKIAKQFEGREISAQDATARIEEIGHKSGVAFVYLQQYARDQPGIVKQVTPSIAIRKQAVANYHAAKKIFASLHQETHQKLNSAKSMFELGYYHFDKLVN